MSGWTFLMSNRYVDPLEELIEKAASSSKSINSDNSVVYVFGETFYSYVKLQSDKVQLMNRVEQELFQHNKD